MMESLAFPSFLPCQRRGVAWNNQKDGAYLCIPLLLGLFMRHGMNMGSSQDEMKTKVVYAKVAASTPPVKAPVFSPPASSFKPPISAPPVKSPPSAKPPVYSPPPIITPMPPVRSKKDCVPLCHKRCQNHSRMNLCLRACNTCCDRCKCVPPGTYGNREICGKCYTEMTTRGNKPKCP